MCSLIVKTDGGSRGNPGLAACAAYFPQLGEVVGHVITHATCNEAEFHGLILALTTAKQLKTTRLKILMDSQLVVRQINGQYKVKSPTLLPLYNCAMNLIATFDNVEIEHIPRAQNQEADAKCNEIMDEEGV